MKIKQLGEFQIFSREGLDGRRELVQTEEDVLNRSYDIKKNVCPMRDNQTIFS